MTAALLASWAGLAQAATAAPAVPESTFVRELLALIMPLAFVIVLLVVILVLLRRRMMPQGPARGLFKVRQIIPVGPRERVVVMQTPSGRGLMIGVGGTSPRLICELDAAEFKADDTEPGADERAGGGWLARVAGTRPPAGAGRPTRS